MAFMDRGGANLSTNGLQDKGHVGKEDTDLEENRIPIADSGHFVKIERMPRTQMK